MPVRVGVLSGVVSVFTVGAVGAMVSSVISALLVSVLVLPTASTTLATTLGSTPSASGLISVPEAGMTVPVSMLHLPLLTATLV